MNLYESAGTSSTTPSNGLRTGITYLNDKPPRNGAIYRVAGHTPPHCSNTRTHRVAAITNGTQYDARNGAIYRVAGHTLPHCSNTHTHRVAAITNGTKYNARNGAIYRVAAITLRRQQKGRYLYPKTNAIMDHTTLINQTVAYVKQELANAEGGHDWFHIERVWNNAKLLLQTEKADALVVELGALLHDIADSKFHGGDETIGPAKATAFLRAHQCDEAVIEHVVNIINHISFKGGNQAQTFQSAELDVVQDADRLDAIGAIGIARAFNFGGFKNRPLHDPSVPPKLQMSKEEYKQRLSPTLNHFWEKLFLLKDRMNTATGKRLAEERDAFMHQFVNRFLGEWEGKL